MRGRTPSSAFLERVRRGEIGGAVLFSENYGPAGPGNLIRQLQAATGDGHQPPLLVAIDQEGGLVKRLAGAPSLAPPQMRSARLHGRRASRPRATSRVSASTPTSPPCWTSAAAASSLPAPSDRRPRSWPHAGSPSPRGLARGRVFATAKHFPGLGYAQQTTDTSQTVVTASRRALQGDLAPFRAAVRASVPLVMVSTASYPSLGARVPAACSSAIVGTLLRRQLRFGGVVVTDALDTPAVHTYFSTAGAAEAAIRAGVDMVLAGGTTSADAGAASRQVFDRLLRDARSGALPRRPLEQAYGRITRLKSGIARR